MNFNLHSGFNVLSKSFLRISESLSSLLFCASLKTSQLFMRTIKVVDLSFDSKNKGFVKEITCYGLWC